MGGDLLETVMETDRLNLFPLTTAYSEALFEQLGHAKLYRFIPQNPPESLAALTERHRRLSSRKSPDNSERWLNWVMQLRATSQYVGMLEATVYTDRTARIAYTVFHAHWKKGFGREGCKRILRHLSDDYGVHRVIAEIDTRNASSIQLVEALGFVLKETVVAADHFKGESSDEFHYEKAI